MLVHLISENLWQTTLEGKRQLSVPWDETGVVSERVQVTGRLLSGAKGN